MEDFINNLQMTISKTNMIYIRAEWGPCQVTQVYSILLNKSIVFDYFENIHVCRNRFI